MNASPRSASPAPRASRSPAGGLVQVLGSEALAVPSGIVLVILFTRWLGPSQYGLFAVISAVVVWIEWALAALLNRPGIQALSASPDWRTIAPGFLRLHLLAGSLAGLGLALLAGPLAGLFGEPVAAAHLRLLALDIPLFCLALCHRNLLVAVGSFGSRAIAGAGRHLGRLLLGAGLVAAGFSVTGAILGNIGASLLELLLARWYVRPSLRGGSRPDWGAFWRLAATFFLFGTSVRLFEKLDLLMLQTLGGTPGQVGSYGAAATAAAAVGLRGLSVSPLLLSILTRSVRDGRPEEARRISRAMLRGVFQLLPFVALGAASAGEIAALLFGPGYAAASPVLRLLLFGAIAGCYLSFAASILTSAGKAAWAPGLSLPMVGLAFCGHLLLIPRLGPLGAALVSTVCAGLGLAGATWAVHRAWRAAPPGRSVACSLLGGGLAYAAGAAWPAGGLLVLVKLAVLGAGCAGFLILAGEWGRREVELLRAVLPLARVTPVRREG